ncbi:MAG: hypothetical protein E7318_02165 [Clostridiales bacterium]|nr:hypothetical protein [Clostridiales bacterium]
MNDYSTKWYNWLDEMPDISIDRVKKLPVPLLVIGLGGTGAEIVNTVKKTFSERFYPAADKPGQELPDPPHTAYRLLDIDEHARGQLSSTEFVHLVIRGMRDILDPGMRDVNLTSAENAWFDRRLDGGDYFWHHRQAVRFMLSRMYTQVYGTIRHALASIAAPLQADEQLSRIEIVICTGICGATGSGIFLDVPQIIRHIMATEPDLAGKDYRITGYIVMPDVSLRALIGNPMADVLRMNAYASLKELDFWMQVSEHKTPYTMQYGNGVKVSWTLPPYDDCFLLSGERADGTVIPDVRTLYHTVAEHLFNYCASDYFFGYPLGCPDAVMHAGSAFPRPLPAYYGYSAIGICSARSPKRRMLQLESKMLLESFLPLQEETGCMLASDAQCTDGKTAERAQTIIGDVKQYHDAFAMTVKLPGICCVTAADKPRIESMREMQPCPHDQENIKPTMWVDSIVKPAASVTADNYLIAAWKRFEDFCRSVILNPDLGPFALLHCLEHGNLGLIKELEAKVLSWQNLARKFINDLTPLKQACTATWPDFEHPPLLGRTKALEAYLQNLNKHYAGLRKAAFMEAHARAAQLLLMRVNEYLAQALKPMCADLKRLHEHVCAEPKTALLPEFDIVEAESIRQQISQAYAVGNADNRLTKRFLEDLYKESFKVTPDGLRDSSGVSFLYRKEGIDALLSRLRNILDDGFAMINDWSIDQLLDHAADEIAKQPQELADHAIREASVQAE